MFSKQRGYVYQEVNPPFHLSVMNNSIQTIPFTNLVLALIPVIVVIVIIILGLAIHPVLANDAAEEKAETTEKAAESKQ